MQNINVNIVPDNFPQTIRYSQGDIGRQFKINVTDFEIPNGATVKVQATKPSGFGFSVAGVVAGSSVTFTTTAEMTDEAGRFQAKLQITSGDDVIGTANFLMIGERNPHPEGTTDGSQGTIIPELTLLVERVEAAASSVLDMEVVANTLPAGSQATYSYDEDLNKATFGIPEGQAGAGAAGVVASAYSAAKTYKVGDYVLYNSNLYRCTTAITTAEAWTAAHWTQVVLADDVTDLKTDLVDSDDKLFSQNYAKKTLTFNDNSENYKIKPDGLLANDSNSNIYRCDVQVGQIICVVGAEQFQFQNTRTIPASAPSNVIGHVFRGQTIGVVPSGASKLIVSALKASDCKAFIYEPLEIASNLEHLYSLHQAKNDVFFHETFKWQRGTRQLPFATTRLITKDFIDISTVDKIHIRPYGTTNIQVLFECFTGNETDGYTYQTDYGYYSNGDLDFSNHPYTAVRILLKHSDNSDINVNEVINAPIAIYFDDIPNTPTRFRVIQYNIGKFNYGLSGGLASNVEEKIANYKNFFADTNADALMMQEFTEYIDSAQTYKSDTTLFDYLFLDKSVVTAETSIKCQHKFLDSAFSYLHQSGGQPSWCVYSHIMLNGKKVALVSAVHSYTTSEAEKESAITKLLTQLIPNDDFVILCMDTNVLSKSEADTLKTFMASKGFVSGNWNYFGYKDTYRLNAEEYKAIDNVYVKGGKLVNFIVPNVYADLSSDHFPVIADIWI